MSGLLPHRSAVFLEEMGVGPQWRLRTRAAADIDAGLAVPAAAESGAVAEPDDAGSSVVAHAAVHAPAAASSAAIPPAPPVVQPQASALAPQSAAWDDTPAPAAAAQAPEFAAAAPALEPAPPPPAAPAQAPAPAGNNEHAWFDDAPAPAPSRAPTPSAGHAAPAPTAHAAPATRATPAAPAVRGPVSAEEIAAMDWPALQASVTACTRCALCKTREAAVPGRGDENASWLILDTAPNADDEEFAEPITANPGRLLDNMLRAVNQSTQAGAYITTLVKCRPSNADGSQRLPTQEELSACRPYLDRELQLTQAKVVLALGHTTGKGLLGAAARCRIMLLEEKTPVVATYHPADLLQRPEEKAKAWADLCLAKSAHAGRR